MPPWQPTKRARLPRRRGHRPLSATPVPEPNGMASDAAPQRGEVWLVSFDASIGGEIQKTRPAVIISNNTANALLNCVQVVPISSQTERLYPAEAYVALNGERRKAMADQIATTSKRRLHRRLGSLGTEDMAAVGRAIYVARQWPTRSPRQASAGCTGGSVRSGRRTWRLSAGRFGPTLKSIIQELQSLLYPTYARTRKPSGSMTRKLSVT